MGRQKKLLLLVPVFSQTLLALVRSHFVFLSFLSTWHKFFNFSRLGGRVKQLF